MTEIEKIHKDNIDRIIKENIQNLSKINNDHLSQPKSNNFPKVKAAQIGGPDIDMEMITDKDGKIHYVIKK